jgi:hypothetical protein
MGPPQGPGADIIGDARCEVADGKAQERITWISTEPLGPQCHGLPFGGPPTLRVRKASVAETAHPLALSNRAQNRRAC